jgi:hypothetical protein
MSKVTLGFGRKKFGYHLIKQEGFEERYHNFPERNNLTSCKKWLER